MAGVRRGVAVGVAVVEEGCGCRLGWGKEVGLQAWLRWRRGGTAGVAGVKGCGCRRGGWGEGVGLQAWLG